MCGENQILHRSAYPRGVNGIKLAILWHGLGVMETKLINMELYGNTEINF